MILIQLETHSEKSEIGTLTPILLHNKSYVSKKKITILEENTCGVRSKNATKPRSHKM